MVSVGMLIAISIVLSSYISDKNYNAKKENCVNAGYAYVDNQCLDVKVIEL